MHGPARALARLVRAVEPAAREKRRHHRPRTAAPAPCPRARSGAWAPRLDEGSVLISATNGKTTTAAMVAAALERDGRPVVHNRAGSNMAWGVATALLDAGRSPGQTGLFEVDEAWLPSVTGELHPRLLLLANLFRDQLDRYGELESLADRWAELVSGPDAPPELVLNADDPLVADLGRDRDGVTYFGLEDDSQALPELQHAADSKHCRNCGAAYHYDAVYLGHMGRYRCPSCGRERPRPDVAATSVRLEGMSGSQRGAAHAGRARSRSGCPLPGLYNVYNAIAATATALRLGVPLATAGAALESFAGAFGRVETIPVDGRELSILLIKNPAGANEVLRTITLEDGALDLWIALNDRIADGRDVSWVWDADFELLRGRVRRVTCSGTRAEELAVRLKYAGLGAADRGRPRARALARLGPGRHRRAGACSRCPPTRRCSSSATCSRAAGSPRGGRHERPRRHLARRRVRLLLGRPPALAGARVARPAGPCSTSAPGPGAWRGRSHDARPQRPRARLGPRPPRRAQRALARGHRRSHDRGRAALRPRGALRARDRADAARADTRRPRRARGDARAGAPPPDARRAVRRRAGRPVRGGGRGGPLPPLPGHVRERRLGASRASRSGCARRPVR